MKAMNQQKLQINQLSAKQPAKKAVYAVNTNVLTVANNSLGEKQLCHGITQM